MSALMRPVSRAVLWASSASALENRYHSSETVHRLRHTGRVKRWGGERTEGRWGGSGACNGIHSAAAVTCDRCLRIKDVSIASQPRRTGVVASNDPADTARCLRTNPSWAGQLGISRDRPTDWVVFVSTVAATVTYGGLQYNLIPAAWLSLSVSPPLCVCVLVCVYLCSIRSTQPSPNYHVCWHPSPL